MRPLVEEVLDDEVDEEAALLAAMEAEFDENIIGDDPPEEPPLSEDEAKWLDGVIIKVLVFLEDMCERKLFPYQYEVGYRIIQSILLNDGEIVTVEQARQSGKSEVLANVIATLMVLLPRLAKAFPHKFSMYDNGFWVGVFAPTEDQADTVWGRIVDRLTSDRAVQLMIDPEIDDKVTKEGGKSKLVKLKKSGSFCRRMTANPKAKVESKSYHFILIDECQDVDSFIVEKSIGPMLAFYNGSRVYTGTPARTKNIFYKTITQNKRHDTKRGVNQNHYSYDYRFVCKYNAQYKKFIAGEKARLGEDSDEFQLSYCCKWLLDQGQFVSEESFEALGDKGMKTYPQWFKGQGVVVGVDPARRKDSTVVSVVWVDWERPDAFGFYEHRVLNWLEIHNQEWEKQYYLIADFLSNYKVLRIGVDTTGMGSAVHDRLRVLFPEVDVIECPSDIKTQGERWKHLKTLIERKAFTYPAHAAVRRTRAYKRFFQQMVDLETTFHGKYMLAEAPDDNDAHDDYADSVCIACSLSLVDTLQEVEVIDSPFIRRRR